LKAALTHSAILQWADFAKRYNITNEFTRFLFAAVNKGIMDPFQVPFQIIFFFAAQSLGIGEHSLSDFHITGAHQQVPGQGARD